ncbi:YggU family protein [Candidatus Woesearchaeota archaeon]|nr:YggU family protein [Candidatus Woesearchaeota archaeon]
MIFGVRVKPNSSKTEVISFDENKNEYLVSVSSPPVDGKANLALEKLFSKILKKPVKIKSGRTSKMKIFETKD